MRRLALCMGMVLAAAGTAWGEPLAGSSLPATTQWVIHADVEGALQAKPLWDAARSRLGELPRVALLPQAAVLERITNMKVPEELRDVTLYSSSFNDADVCVRVHGKMDSVQVEAFLKLDKEFKQTAYGERTIMQWRDKARDRLMYVSFARPDLAVLSPNLEAVERSLDTLDGKTEGLKADSALAPTAPEGDKKTMVWIAAKDLSALPRGQVESPVLGQIDAASLGLSWANDRLLAEMRVAAKSEQTAQQLKALAEGIKAFVELTAADEHAAPGLRLLGGTMEQLTVQTEGRLVKGSWAIGIDKIDMLLNVATLDRGTGATSPATEPGNLP